MQKRKRERKGRGGGEVKETFLLVASLHLVSLMISFISIYIQDA